MKGTPMSIWLSWANRAAAWWAGAAAAGMQQQRNTTLNAAKRRAGPAKPKPRTRRKRR